MCNASYCNNTITTIAKTDMATVATPRLTSNFHGTNPCTMVGKEIRFDVRCVADSSGESGTTEKGIVVLAKAEVPKHKFNCES